MKMRVPPYLLRKRSLRVAFACAAAVQCAMLTETRTRSSRRARSATRCVHVANGATAHTYHVGVRLQATELSELADAACTMATAKRKDVSSAHGRRGSLSRRQQQQQLLLLPACARVV
jgi:hypothetical protein